MNMSKAIAHSTANKAKATNEYDHEIVVQERYQGATETWLHIWEFWEGGANEADLPDCRYYLLEQIYYVDPKAECWESIK